MLHAHPSVPSAQLFPKAEIVGCSGPAEVWLSSGEVGEPRKD